MSDQTATISTSFPAPAKPAPARAAARTKLILEGPIFSTLLRMSAPNVLNLLAFAGMVTFDGSFSAASAPMRSPAPRWCFPG